MKPTSKNEEGVGRKFRVPFERLSNVDECKLLQVIEVKSLVGVGDGVGSPNRQIIEYYSTEGVLLARRDFYVDGELQKGLWSEATPPTPTNNQQKEQEDD